MTSRNLCLFDLDHTLLPIDSDHAWGEFVIRQGWVDPDEFGRGNDRFYAQYQAGTLDIHAYIDFATRPWRDRPQAEMAAAHERFMAEAVRPALRPAALELVRRHQAQGDLVALVTATNEFVTAPIARAFGIDHLLAVRLERGPAGNITGRIDGEPSFREGKTVQIPSAIQTGKQFGMVTLDDAIMGVLQKGWISPEEAYDKSIDKSKFKSLLKTPPDELNQ